MIVKDTRNRISARTLLLGLILICYSIGVSKVSAQTYDFDEGIVVLTEGLISKRGEILKKEKIAVFGIIDGKSRKRFEISSYIEDGIVDVLVNEGYTVIERRRIDDVIKKEIKKTVNLWFDESSVAQFGKLVGADVVVTGRYGRWGHSMLKINIRAIKVANGKILAANKVKVLTDRIADLLKPEEKIKPPITVAGLSDSGLTRPSVQKDYQITNVRFFEGGDSTPDVADRRYGNKFPRETTRRIYTELRIKNFRYKERAHEHDVEWVYYNPNGSIWGKMNSKFNVKSIWENAWIQRGWGWSNAGNWSSGTYRVKLFIDGTEVAENTFKILPAKKDYEITNVRFFEAGDSTPDVADRRYGNKFPRETTRRIYTELRIKNFRYKERAHEHDVEWVYYNPNGSIWGKMNSKFNVKSIWENAWIQRGWGWSNAGNWSSGTYRVKLFIDGTEVAEESFVIY